ncbi:hypothetical protein LJC33_06585 [Eubacteriales bacterium OttesenSCG-928-N13]|nr:hypothetical protein [Eubacteriales bacterium OttesenSCG-928-N13]
MKYRVTHNGYTVNFFETVDDVEAYMKSTLDEYRELDPREIYRSYGADNQADEKRQRGDNITIKSVIIWQYKTLYTEVFMIEEFAE